MTSSNASADAQPPVPEQIGTLFPDLANLPKEDLHPELAESLFPMSMGGQRIVHRFMVEIFYNPFLNAHYNRVFAQQKELADKAMDERNWSAYLYYHAKPFRITVFDEIQECLTDAEYWDLLGGLWKDSENLWQEGPDLLLDLMNAQRFKRELLMDEKDRQLFESLPDEFLIYRGHMAENQMGLSWTLSFHDALWFANRWAPSIRGEVSMATVSKKDVLAVFRQEEEVVVDPSLLTNVRSVTKLTPSLLVDRVRPYAKRAFILGEHSIHGRWHWEKVERNAVWLSDHTPGSDQLVARLFAALHDCKRQNENRDPEHGDRSAAFAQHLYDKGVLKELKPKQLELLKEACRLHEKGMTSTDPTLGVCWDSDRLDLIRVNIIPDPKFFSTDAAKKHMWRF
jgi:uncharacterized protein